MKKNIAAIVGMVVLFFVSPNHMGESLPTIAIWFALVYYGYKNSMKVQGLESPFLAFTAAIVANMIYLALFGSPDTNTQMGIGLFLVVPVLISFIVIKTFYALEKPKDKSVKTIGNVNE